MKPIILSKLNAEIARRNRIFDKATKAQKRVLLAQDVLDQLDAKRLKARVGVWLVAIDEEDRDDGCDMTPNPSLQRAALADEVTCEACAVGSLILSCVLFKNKIKTADVLKPFWDMGVPEADIIRKLFSEHQLALIEGYYEGCEGGLDYHTLTKRQIVSARCYADRAHPDDDTRLRLILGNIIKHKGTFVPPEYDDKTLNRYCECFFYGETWQKRVDA